MAVGKNKKLNKKKGAKKKSADAFARKEWYHLRAPTFFENPKAGRIVVTKTTGTKIAKDSLMGRVVEVNIGELKKTNEEESFLKFKLKVDDVQGFQCLTNFHGMDLTTDKLRNLVRRSHTLIEAHTDVKTADGFTLRLFCIGFTSRRPNQSRVTSYAQSGQVRQIRKRMIDIMQRETANTELKDVVSKLIPGTIGQTIEKAVQGIYPLHNVLIRKVKVLRSPKVDVSRLMELHGGASALEEAGKVVERTDTAAPAAATEETTA